MGANPQSAVLIRAAIRGDSDSLGQLLELFRPTVLRYSWHFLGKFRLEHHAEDLTQDVLCGVIASFPRYDPIGGNFPAWVKVITIRTSVNFLKSNPVLLRQVPIPEEGPEADEDFQPNPLDGLSRECWERDHPEAPVSQSPRRGPKRRASRRLKAKEKKTAPAPSGRGANLRLTRGEKISRARRRNRFAAEVSP